MSEEVVVDAPDTVETPEATEPTVTVEAGEEVTTTENNEEVVTKPEEGAEKSQDGEADKDNPNLAPEKYEDFTFPEGVEINEKVVSEFSDLAKELNLPQDTAQKLVDFHARQQLEMATDQMVHWENTVSGWLNDAKADKEIGGKSFKENIAVAREAVSTFGTPELKEAFDATGTGNHPEFLRFLYRVGKAISEDKIHAGQSGSSPVDRAKTLFPNNN